MRPVAPRPAPPGAALPLFDVSIKAGFPSPAQDSGQEELDFNRLLAPHPASTFCLRVSGDSMIGAGIEDGDILVVDRARQPHNGNIFVAALNGEFTVKRLERRPSGVRLVAANPKYAPIDIEAGTELIIFGVVTGLARTLAE